MNKATITALVGAEHAKEIMKLAGSAQAKYLLTDGGKIAKIKANANYRMKQEIVNAPIVSAHLIELTNNDLMTLTDIWNHYRTDYVLLNKPHLTRVRYKALLDELKIPIVNPHTRNGIKYYGPAYDLSKMII